MSANLEAQAAAEATLQGFLWRQREAPKPLPAGTSAKGQTSIITGSNTGLGLEASRQLLRLGLSHLVMGVRSKERGEAAAEQLRAEFPDAKISVWIVDMASYDSIRAFAAKCGAELERIDSVILNAAVQTPQFSLVEATGHELTMQTNYLSTAFLSLLLVPVLKAKKKEGAAPPVLSIVGSDTSYMTTLLSMNPALPACDKPENYSQFQAYARAKLLLVFFVAKLAEHVDPADVIINYPNPGLTKGTEIGRSATTLSKVTFAAMQYLLARELDVGASVYLDAVFNYGAKGHGSFISDWTIKPYPPVWYTEEGKQLRTSLWEETLNELKPAGAPLP
ncbi:hypothetical protein MGG_00357 [Pyricularia oryzae 70-15]|uniref:Retinol dehydrogenase 14 n=3 Tax=Pyricularia oryzae TaxID=318829 RepID=G4NCP6_PYRO7|nr:uncharacterized protein MGG_00357 [Pyricularia oryzae 70-15]EHA49140.1 hypothetical protein MGG_00357 [Pyricularia oryzae 70-15]ELQ37235.1 retinol dehydrogenase 14 [Pyricularia oryzae Y34]KAI7922029.1 hypothetical protein M0657_005827 [Pyricularia oryzae]KAI7924270.1 hypothetical protein M9X92_003887 [Pyricularia oryzae]